MSSAIEIRKYEYQATRLKNYFSEPEFIDRIVLDKILIEGFPIFNEEFTNQFNSFEYVSSDYDLVFSRLENTLTEEDGITLEEFLSNDLDNHCLMCKVIIGDKVFGGSIDVNSITFIDDLTSDGYRIKITIFSLAKEIATSFSGAPVLNEFPETQINLYLEREHFRMMDASEPPSDYFVLDTSLLNWNARCGYTPVLVKELWEFIIDNHLPEGCNTWKLFLDMCTAFGIIYKIEFAETFTDYFGISLKLAFRDTGFTSETIEVKWLHRERGFISDINANVIQCFKSMKAATVLGTGNVPIQVNDTFFYGTVFDKTRITTTDGNVFSIGGGFTEEIFAQSGEGFTIVKQSDPFPFSFTDKVNIVEFNYYFATNYFSTTWRYYMFAQTSDGFYQSPNARQVKYISFPRIFTKAGYIIEEIVIPGAPHNVTIIKHTDNVHDLWYALIENTCGVCYTHLLSTFKKWVSGIISLQNGFNVNNFNKIVVNDETYTIYRLSDLNYQQKQIAPFAIQD